MPAISALRRQARYDTILAAAQTAFAGQGYEAVSIAQIAKAAGVSDGLVYHYFRDKRDLLFAVLHAFYQRITLDCMAAIQREETFAARLEALIRAHLKVFVSDADLCRLFISEVRVERDYQGSAIQELNREYTSTLLKIVREGTASGEVVNKVPARIFRDAVFGAIEHRAWQHVVGGGPLDVSGTARSLTQLFLHGLCGTGAAA